MGCFGEIRSMNFSLYGQWLGLASIALLIALGIVGLSGHVVFSIVGWVIAFIVMMVEVPLCLKFCPTGHRFDGIAPYFENSYFRTAMYLVFAIVMFLSNILHGATPLIACAVCLLLAAISYGAAAVMGQAFASTSMLGGTGVDNVV